MTTGNEKHEREALAEYAHDCWSRWMAHLLSRTIQNADGSMTIAPTDVHRWQRQRVTAYDELTEQEQVSDRAEADRMLDVLRQAGFLIQRQGKKEPGKRLHDV